MLNLIIMGAPGAGKGTQSELICKNYQIPHISTGDMFREAAANKTELGLAAKAYMDRGDLVPDEVTIGIVRERLAKDDCARGYLLDGFPRTLVQAEALKNLLVEIGRPLSAVINLDVDEDRLINRIAARRVCPVCGASYNLETKASSQKGICDNCGAELILRDDDRPESFRVRLAAYKSKTLPLVEYYRSEHLLHAVDGLGSISEVYSAIASIIEDNR